MLPKLLEGFEKHPVYSETEKVRIDMLRRFGYYTTESNGHLSEYVPWYRKRPDEIMQWIDLSSWINGETGGYLRVCTEGRNWFETDFPNWLAEPGLDLATDKRSEEHGSYIIEALRDRAHLPRAFQRDQPAGTSPTCPTAASSRSPATWTRTASTCRWWAICRWPAPRPARSACTCSRWRVEAGVHGDVTLLKQAMLHDPLIGAVCNPTEVWQMTDEMLVAQAKWLPQYADEIPAAAARLAAAEADGTRVALRDWDGAARLHTKTVEEMAADRAAATASAAAADKGNMTKEGAH